MNRLMRRWACIAGITGVLLYGNSVLAQQWERLPLNVGYLDELVHNPWNPMEIVGYVQNGNFYRSTDGGSSWKKIEQDSVPFRRSYHRLTMDPLGRYYLMTHQDGLWRSSDIGMTWENIPVPGERGYSSSSRVLFGLGRDIFLWEGRTPTLYISRDDGITWLDRGPQGLKIDLDFYLDARSNALMFVLTKNQIVVTTDTGLTWSTYSLPRPANSVLFAEHRDTSLVLQYLSGLDASEVMESCDTGKTWQPETEQSIRVNQGDCLHDIFITERRFRMNDSTDVYPICHTLQRSTDSGRTFRQITDFRVEDAVQVGTDLIASVPLRGLIRSTDFGDTWLPVPSPPEMFRADHIEFAHANDDTMFVMIKGQEIPGKLVANLLESDAGGMNWNLLFSTVNSTLSSLAVDAGRPARYYLQGRKSADLHILLTGVAGQIVPDTVLVTTSFARPTELYPPETFQCFPSERFPGWIYASRNTNSIGWSSDRGESWEWHALPISGSMVRAWPTQRDPLRIIVSASELNPIAAFDCSGLYLIENGGQSFEWINRSDRLGGRLFTTRSDRIFYYDSSSTDCGRTWETMRTGFDSSTTSVDHYQSHGWTVTITNTGMYLFDDERWKLLRDPDGNSIWDERMVGLRHGAAISLDYTGTQVYVAIPDRGLYRIATQPVTGVVSPPSPATGRLNVYPNPAGTQVTIAWQGIEGSRGGLVRILDVLGREVWRFDTTSVRDRTIWDCTGPGGMPVPPGLYLAHLTDGQYITTTNVLIIR